MIAILLLPLLIFLGTLAFFGIAWFAAYIDIKSRPREAMMWCHKHGHYRKGHAIPMVGTLVCPQCYLEALSTTGNQVTLRR